MSGAFGEAVGTMVTVIVCVILLSIVMGFIVQVTGEGSDPGMVRDLINGISTRFVSLG